MNKLIVLIFASLFFLGCSKDGETTKENLVDLESINMSFEAREYDFGERFPQGSDYSLGFFKIKNDGDEEIEVAKFKIEGDFKECFKVDKLVGKINKKTQKTFHITFIPPTKSDVNIQVTLTAIEKSGKECKIILKGKTSKKITTGQIVYINPKAKGTNDGTSWENAFTDFEKVLKMVGKGNVQNNEFWLAKGTYNAPKTGFYFCQANKYYGGFAGNETQRNQRNIVQNRTIFNGNNTSYHVVQIVPPTSGDRVKRDLVIDGFDITGGAATAPINNSFKGAGMNIGNFKRTTWSFTHIKVLNCRIYKNKSAIYSAGIQCNHAPSTFVNCIISENEGGCDAGKDQKEVNRLYFGKGGIISVNNNEVASFWVNFINCTIANNKIGPNSNAKTMVNFNKKSNLKNCIIWGDAEILSAVNVYNCIINKTDGIDMQTNYKIDPLFNNVAAMDFSLKAGSPAIDKGDNSLFPQDIQKDINFNQRINGTIDIGAIEN